jgi:hypothetical protein
VSDYPEMAERFKRDTADHVMTVAHDDGLYRHLKFRNPKHSWNYWFDLITVPGALIFQGAGQSFVFRRTEDMFAFFRGSAWKGAPNYSYWAEELTDGGRDSVMRYSEDLFVREVKERFVEDIRDGSVPPGTSKALLEHFEWVDHSFEQNARDALDSFEHKGFCFRDTWEWDFRDYHWWYLWACQAIVWGINRYDAARQPEAVAS